MNSQLAKQYRVRQHVPVYSVVYMLALGNTYESNQGLVWRLIYPLTLPVPRTSRNSHLEKWNMEVHAGYATIHQI